MKQAQVVIGANFGDEGKGLFVDYLCDKGAEVVVRFNGGAQAGHTVVTPQGVRHVFRHFGSGTLCSVPTFLSQFFIINPILFLKELEELVRMGEKPKVYAHPACLVTTFADMIINQRIEEAKGKYRHGSVGIGFNETILRSELIHLKITMGDLWNGVSLESRLKELCGKYANYRCASFIESAEGMIEAFGKACAMCADAILPAGIEQFQGSLVFEGAQGLLLDMGNKKFFPHLTRSNTGMKNVRTLCGQAGIKDVKTYYISRTYLTRHGAGPLPGESPTLHYEDNTNLEHPYQGAIRFAPLNEVELLTRCAEDNKGEPYSLVLTHCDQAPLNLLSSYRSFGPVRSDVERMK